VRDGEEGRGKSGKLTRRRVGKDECGRRIGKR
jgi:hypothetical protein